MEHEVVGSDQTQPSGSVLGGRESRWMRHVNRGMRAATGSFALFDPIAFFCECQASTCYSVVWVSAADFDVIESGRSGWLLVEGHEASTPLPERAIDPSDRRSGGRLDDWLNESIAGGEVA